MRGFQAFLSKFSTPESDQEGQNQSEREKSTSSNVEGFLSPALDNIPWKRQETTKTVLPIFVDVDNGPPTFVDDPIIPHLRSGDLVGFKLAVQESGHLAQKTSPIPIFSTREETHVERNKKAPPICKSSEGTHEAEFFTQNPVWDSDYDCTDSDRSISLSPRGELNMGTECKDGDCSGSPSTEYFVLKPKSDPWQWADKSTQPEGDCRDKSPSMRGSWKPAMRGSSPPSMRGCSASSSLKSLWDSEDPATARQEVQNFLQPAQSFRQAGDTSVDSQASTPLTLHCRTEDVEGYKFSRPPELRIKSLSECLSTSRNEHLLKTDTGDSMRRTISELAVNTRPEASILTNSGRYSTQASPSTRARRRSRTGLFLDVDGAARSPAMSTALKRAGNKSPGLPDEPSCSDFSSLNMNKYSRKGSLEVNGFRISTHGIARTHVSDNSSEWSKAAALTDIEGMETSWHSVSSLDNSRQQDHRDSPSRQPHHSFITLEGLGRGCGGNVHRAIHAISLRFVAIKEVPVHDDSRLQQIINEIKTLRNCNFATLDVSKPPCPNLVTFYDAFMNPRNERVTVVLELCSNGSLADVLSSAGKIPEAELQSVAADVLNGIAFLQQHCLLHRDIKPANILLTLQNGKPVAKIADFGLVKRLGEGQNPDEKSPKSDTQDFVGTPIYMSPERLQGFPYSYPSDIWSVGLTLLTCALGKYPVEVPHEDKYWFLLQLFSSEASVRKFGMNEAFQFEKTASTSTGKKTSEVIEVLMSKTECDTLPPLFIDLLCLCLQKKPEDRLTAAELLQHGWLQSRKPVHAGFFELPANSPHRNSASTDDTLRQLCRRIAVWHKAHMHRHQGLKDKTAAVQTMGGLKQSFLNWFRMASPRGRQISSPLKRRGSNSIPSKPPELATGRSWFRRGQGSWSTAELNTAQKANPVPLLPLGASSCPPGERKKLEPDLWKEHTRTKSSLDNIGESVDTSRESQNEQSHSPKSDSLIPEQPYSPKADPSMASLCFRRSSNTSITSDRASSRSPARRLDSLDENSLNETGEYIDVILEDEDDHHFQSNERVTMTGHGVGGIRRRSLGSFKSLYPNFIRGGSSDAPKTPIYAVPDSPQKYAAFEKTRSLGNCKSVCPQLPKSTICDNPKRAIRSVPSSPHTCGSFIKTRGTENFQVTHGKKLAPPKKRSPSQSPPKNFTDSRPGSRPLSPFSSGANSLSTKSISLKNRLWDDCSDDRETDTDLTSPVDNQTWEFPLAADEPASGDTASTQNPWEWDGGVSPQFGSLKNHRNKIGQIDIQGYGAGDDLEHSAVNSPSAFFCRTLQTIKDKVFHRSSTSTPSAEKSPSSSARSPSNEECLEESKIFLVSSELSDESDSENNALENNAREKSWEKSTGREKSTSSFAKGSGQPKEETNQGIKQRATNEKRHRPTLIFNSKAEFQILPPKASPANKSAPRMNTKSPSTASRERAKSQIRVKSEWDLGLGKPGKGASQSVPLPCQLQESSFQTLADQLGCDCEHVKRMFETEWKVLNSN